MTTRGPAPTLSQRVAQVEEDIRNIRRLPGTVVPPPLQAVTVEGGGMVEDMWASFAASVSVGPGSGLTYVLWDTPGPYTHRGAKPPEVAGSLFGGNWIAFTAPGYHLCRLTVAGDSVADEVVTAVLSANGSVNVPVVQDATLAGAAGTGMFAIRSFPTSPSSMIVAVHHRDLADTRSFVLGIAVSRIGMPQPDAAIIGPTYLV